MRSPRVCPFCRQRVTGRCEKCSPIILEDQAEAKRLQDKQRGSAAARGYGHRWRKARETWLKKPGNQWCVYCLAMNPPRHTIANIIDHFIPHRGDQKKFWDRANWRPACKRCHDLKTARGQ